MRANEISESVKSPSVIAHTSDGVWYEIDAHKVNQLYAAIYGSSSILKEVASHRYFVCVHEGTTLKSYLNQLVVQTDADSLVSVGASGQFNSKQDAELLQALVDVIRVKNGKYLRGDFVLYEGMVLYKYDCLNHMPKVAQISTGPIYEIPKDALWLLGRLYLKYQVSADRVVVFKNTSHDVSLPWSCASIKSGQLVNIQSQSKLDAATQVRLSKELTQALGLEQKTSVKTHIIPQSKLHRALQAINDNPEVTRWDLYLRVLKLRKVPSERSSDDVVHELVQMKLVSNVKTQDYEVPAYSITTIGKMVLARVNAGHAVAKSTLLK